MTHTKHSASPEKAGPDFLLEGNSEDAIQIEYLEPRLFPEHILNAARFLLNSRADCIAPWSPVLRLPLHKSKNAPRADDSLLESSSIYLHLPAHEILLVILDPNLSAPSSPTYLVTFHGLEGLSIRFPERRYSPYQAWTRIFGKAFYTSVRHEFSLFLEALPPGDKSRQLRKEVSNLISHLASLFLFFFLFPLNSHTFFNLLYVDMTSARITKYRASRKQSPRSKSHFSFFALVFSSFPEFQSLLHSLSPVSGVNPSIKGIPPFHTVAYSTLQKQKKKVYAILTETHRAFTRVIQTFEEHPAGQILSGMFWNLPPIRLFFRISSFLNSILFHKRRKNSRSISSGGSAPDSVQRSGSK